MKQEAVELGGEDCEETDSDDEPKKKKLYDEWQDIINNRGVGGEEGTMGMGRRLMWLDGGMRSCYTKGKGGTGVIVGYVGD